MQNMKWAALGAATLVIGAIPASISVAQDDGGVDAVLDPGKGVTLKRFASDAAFRAYMIKKIGKPNRRNNEVYEVVPPPPVVVAPAPVSAPAANESAKMSADAAPAAGATANPEITNNQTVGVDEGGIVKQIGNYLIVLQDGRLFSVDLGKAGGTMQVADRVDVYRNTEVAASWYDEMLVLEDRIIVTAYYYGENASEMTVFRMAPDGKITREGRYLISSNDYYSTDNYATRLVGDTLVLYTPQELAWDENGRFAAPRIRRARGDGKADKGNALIRPTEIYAPMGEVDYPVVHTLSFCPLKRDMDCRSVAFVGAYMREFYVSPDSAYLWIGASDGLPWGIDYGNIRRNGCAVGTTWRDPNRGAEALLYRIPINGGAVGAAGVQGTPTDQFSFDAKDGRFRALLRRNQSGCLSPEEQKAGGGLALMDIPLSAFRSTARKVSERAYAPLPMIEGGQLENRFVGNWLIYGGRTGWSSDPRAQNETHSSLFTVPLGQPKRTKQLTIPHNAIRIERAGNDAVVTGYASNDGLSISYVALGLDPHIGGSTMLPNRFESEGRSHAFNAWVKGDGSGIMGIPTTLRLDRSGRGWSDSNNSDLSFIRINSNKKLASAGELRIGDRRANPTYQCKVSCVDWYGNARPIYTGGRIFALMGTDLVEGAMQDGQIAEVGRADLTGKTRLAR